MIDLQLPDVSSPHTAVFTDILLSMELYITAKILKQAVFRSKSSIDAAEG